MGKKVSNLILWYALWRGVKLYWAQRKWTTMQRFNYTMKRNYVKPINSLLNSSRLLFRMDEEGYVKEEVR